MFDMLAIAIVAMCIAIFCSAMLLVFFIRDVRLRNTPPAHAQTDSANMTILFSTMRDVLSEQKDLARQFNQALNKRIGEVREVVDVVREEREIMRESRHELMRLLDKARELHDQIIQASDSVTTAAPLTDSKPIGKAVAETPTPRFSSVPLVSTETPPDALAPPSALSSDPDIPSVIPVPEKSPEPDLIDHWAGLDFGEGRELPSDHEVVEEVEAPIAPEDAAAARDAFRTLLNLGGTPVQPAQAPEVIPQEAPPVERASANGKEDISPVQQRVYEYSDAGMRVPDIARELGVGKGEVRLMLSLRKDKGR